MCAVNIFTSFRVIVILHTTVQNDKFKVDKVWYSMYNIKGVKQSVFTLFINGYGDRVLWFLFIYSYVDNPNIDV